MTRWLTSRLALVALVLAASVPASAAAAEPAGTTPGAWGWVTAREPGTASYTPGPLDRGSSSGVAPTITREGLGSYLVTFPSVRAGGCAGPYGCEGHYQVVALNSRPRVCFTGDSGSDGALGVKVEVLCRDGKGRPADTAFSLVYLRAGELSGGIRYLLADQPTNPNGYDPTLPKNWGGGSTVNEAIRLSTGTYRVYLALADADTTGNLQTTMVPGGACRVLRVEDNPNGADAFIRCRDLAGTVVDRVFWLLFTSQVGATGDTHQPAASLLAERPTAAGPYKPLAARRWVSAGAAPTVRRTSTGVYAVTLPGMPLGGAALVTAYGAGSVRCQLGSIKKALVPQVIGVRCFAPNGTPADGRFWLSFTR